MVTKTKPCLAQGFSFFYSILCINAVAFLCNSLWNTIASVSAIAINIDQESNIVIQIDEINIVHKIGPTINNTDMPIFTNTEIVELRLFFIASFCVAQFNFGFDKSKYTEKQLLA